MGDAGRIAGGDPQLDWGPNDLLVISSMRLTTATLFRAVCLNSSLVAAATAGAVIVGCSGTPLSQTFQRATLLPLDNTTSPMGRWVRVAAEQEL